MHPEELGGGPSLAGIPTPVVPSPLERPLTVQSEVLEEALRPLPQQESSQSPPLTGSAWGGSGP